MSDEKDPWASLADSLGASPSHEPAPPPVRREPEKPKPRPAAQRPVAPRAAEGWDDLDSRLGLPASREATRPAERPPVEPRAAEPRAGHEQRPAERSAVPARRQSSVDEAPRRSDRTERPDHAERGGFAGRGESGERSDGGDAGDDGRRREGGEPRGEGSEPAAEDRPRRRRGRRGGRGRGRSRREGVAGPNRLGDEPAPRDADLDSEPLEDIVDERPATESERGDQPLDEDGRPRRRRRRRGRRGGRRGGATGERSGDAGDDAAGRRQPGDRAGDLDDEPLPSGYGRNQTARQSEARESEGQGDAGERRGRRRRRGRGDDAGRRAATGQSGESSRSESSRGDSSRRRGRRSRRGADSDRGTSSSSSLARRSRDDFAPVSRGYDEDDEGLEFLGVEDAGHEQPRREQRHPDDDVLAESGLDAVRDVPSWVEAIGIVIAGNLDARSRPRSDRGDDDRRRR